MLPRREPAASSFAEGVAQGTTSAPLASIVGQFVLEGVCPLSAIVALHFPVVAIASVENRSPAIAALDFLILCAMGVRDPRSNEKEPLPFVWSADASSAEIDRCAGVTRSFHVSLYKVEPLKANFARNLLAKNERRAALIDEVVERGPEVPLVSKPCSFACRAERLARARSCPNGLVVRPSGKAQGI
jgi:hypothetical protein